MVKKNVTFRVFEIKSSKLTVSAESLCQILSDKIAGTNIEKRLIPIKETDDRINDLLGSHTINSKDFFYGVMMRLKPAKEVKTLPDDFQTLEELTEWYNKSGLPIKKFFNTSGLLYKSLALKARLPEMSEEEQLRLLSTDGMLVKRPILIGEDFVLVGFKENEWKEKI